MNTIEIKKLHVRANHGVFDSEKDLGQNFYIDIKAHLNFYPSTINENLEKSVHYGEMADLISRTFKSQSHDLIETAAYELAITILNEYELINELTITVHKPEAPVNHSYDDIAVSVSLKRNKVYVAMGSNIGDGHNYFEFALNKLNQTNHTKVIAEASRITTKAYGLTDQPDFLNSMLELETYLQPNDLLTFLNEIEADCERKREIKWGPRTLDLDIIFYNNEIINTQNLVVPHYDLHKRDFVLSPMVELNPHFIHPRLNHTMIELLDTLGE